MYLSIYAVYEYYVDSATLYEELRDYKINVTDTTKTVFIYGRINAFYLPTVIYILLKYGEPTITINK